METGTFRPRAVTVKGKTIGTITGDTFLKAVKGSRHKLRRPPGWAIDAKAYETQIQNEARFIEICDTETGLVYTTSINAFNELKKELNRGFGRQYMMPITYWSVKPIKTESLILGG